MRVIAVINQKGGAGKTTVAMNLAAGLARRATAGVVDLDPQSSATQWAAAGTSAFPATVKQLRVGAALPDLRKEFRAFDHIVLDCPPSVDTRAAALALQSCDVALIPVLPSPVDQPAATPGDRRGAQTQSEAASLSAAQPDRSAKCAVGGDAGSAGRVRSAGAANSGTAA